MECQLGRVMMRMDSHGLIEVDTFTMGVRSGAAQPQRVEEVPSSFLISIPTFEEVEHEEKSTPEPVEKVSLLRRAIQMYPQLVEEIDMDLIDGRDIVSKQETDDDHDVAGYRRRADHDVAAGLLLFCQRTGREYCTRLNVSMVGDNDAVYSLVSVRGGSANWREP